MFNNLPQGHTGADAQDPGELGQKPSDHEDVPTVANQRHTLVLPRLCALLLLWTTLNGVAFGETHEHLLLLAGQQPSIAVLVLDSKLVQVLVWRITM